MSQTQPFSKMLVYFVQYLIEGIPHSLVLKPADAANGVILDAPEGSETYHAETVTGRRVEIPIAAVTNVFATWWRIRQDNGKGHDTWSTDDDDVAERAVNRRSQDSKNFDENGALKDVWGREDKPDSGKTIRKRD